MYEYDKEHWKEALYDAAEYDDLDEEESEGLDEACFDMIAAAVEVLRENGYCLEEAECIETALAKIRNASEEEAESADAP